MTYVKPLKVFNRIKITMQITHWDEKYFYATHTFYRGEKIVAEGTSKSLVVSRKDGRLTPLQVLTMVNEYQATLSVDGSQISIEIGPLSVGIESAQGERVT